MNFITQLGSLAIFQFLLEPLQYFSISRIGILPGNYLGRLLSMFLVALLLTSKQGLNVLVKSFRIIFTTYPYAPFSWLTIIAAIPPLFLLNGTLLFRYSIIEPLTNICYLAILTVLPSLIVKPLQLLNLSRIFYSYLFVILAIGYIDFLCSSFGVTFLGRTLFEPIDIGIRFHSLFAEPRDYAVACIYLLAFASVLNLSTHSLFRLPRFNRPSLRLFLLISLFISLPLTYSSSFAIGFALSLLLLIVILGFRFILHFPMLSKITLFIILLLTLLIVVVTSVHPGILFGNRVGVTYDALVSLLSSTDYFSIVKILSNTPLLSPQASTFMPIIKFFHDINSQNPLITLFGYGHGGVNTLLSSFSFVDAEDINNSYAGLPRLLYETGIAGTVAFSYMFASVVQRSLSLPHLQFKKRPRTFCLLLSVLLFSAYLAHRRQELFLYMGVLNCYLSSFSPPSNFINKNLGTQLKGISKIDVAL